MKKLTLERTFLSPVEKVWKAFTNLEALAEWWAPEGMNTMNISVNLEKDGLFHYCFVGEDDTKFWGRGIYQTIESPTRLAYVDSFADADGNAVPSSSYGIPGDEIVESLVEFRFSNGGGTTRMTAEMENPYDDTMLEDMTKGWNSMFDKLDKYLFRTRVLGNI